MDQKRVAVVGGGAAGMRAAIEAARCGHAVTLLEKNEKLGKKLYITGKGRCNLTNAAGRDAFFQNVVHNPRFLYSAYAACSSEDTMQRMEQAGVPLKTERGGRVFPVSDKSSDVLRALENELKKAGVTVLLHTPVTALLTEETDGLPAVRGVVAGKTTIEADAVILATGGLSYPSTGSTGDGLRLAAACGHTVIEPACALVPLETEETWPALLAGLTLKNVTLTAIENGRAVYAEMGELLLTHFGVSGPLALSASSYLTSPAGARLSIDLKPALSPETLDARLLRDLEGVGRQQVKTALSGLLPARLLTVVLEQAGVPDDMQAAAFSRKLRQSLVETLKALPLTVKGTRGFSEAIITRGGVSVAEVNAKTLASKKVSGLYFCGEMLDVDALTGGFNLQIAWATGTLAGRSIG